MYIKYTPSGHLFISPEDDCNLIVDAMLGTDYSEEFCIASANATDDFDPEFVARLMEAGFLVMSMDLNSLDEGEKEPFYLLLPKLHLVRSALFFENLHIKKSIRRHLNRYELHADSSFDHILDRCVEKHGGDWLTPPLVKCIKEIRNNPPIPGVRPFSFALYRDGNLAAGEFGVVCGKVYTSYSGFYEEENAGTVQLIKTTQYLKENGFSFFDLGMPMSYKNDLGALDISPAEFVRLFRGI